MTARVYALLRVSTLDQDPENQRAAIAAQAERDGGTIAPECWIIERDVSGAARVRPGLDEIEARIRRGEVRALYVWALDRLLRDRQRWARLVPEFKRRKVELCIVTGGWRLFGPDEDPMRAVMGELFADFFVAMAVYELEMIRARTRAGLAAARGRGAVLGEPALVWRDEELRELRELRAAGR